MENKNLIIIAIAIIAVIAIVGAIFVSGVFNGNNDLGTSPFKTDFMEGAFAGNVSLADDKEKFMHSYVDKEHNITYNISTVDNSTALMDIMSFKVFQILKREASMATIGTYISLRQFLEMIQP